MRKVTSGDFQRKSGDYQEMAQREPITITKYGRPSLVLLSFEDYQKLTGNTKRALHVTELSPEASEALDNAKMDSKFDYLNDLLEE